MTQSRSQGHRQGQGQVRLSETIHRTNLRTFASIHKAPAASKKGTVKSSRREDAQMIRLFDTAKERGRSMDELLQYDVCSTLPLFDEEGLMTKATKSQIVQELEKHLGEDCPKTPPTSDSAKTGYIVYVMANVRKIKQKASSHFGEFCVSFLRFIQSSA